MTNFIFTFTDFYPFLLLISSICMKIGKIYGIVAMATIFQSSNYKLNYMSIANLLNIIHLEYCCNA